MKLNIINTAFLLLSSRVVQGFRSSKISENTLNQFDDLIHRLEVEKLEEGGKRVSKEAKSELNAFLLSHFDRNYKDKEYDLLLSKLKNTIDDDSLDLTEISTRESLIDIAASLSKLSQSLKHEKEDFGRPNSHMKDFATIYFGLCNEQSTIDSTSEIKFHKYAADTLYDFLLVHYLESSESDSTIDIGLKNFANTLYGLDNANFCVDETQEILGKLFEDLDPNSN